jgi:hypothetical protein
MRSNIIKFIIDLLKNKLYIVISIAYAILSITLNTQIVVASGSGILFVMLSILEYEIISFDEINNTAFGTLNNISLNSADLINRIFRSSMFIIGMYLIIQSMFINMIHTWITIFILFIIILTSFSLVVLGLPSINNFEAPETIIGLEKKCLESMRTAVAA